MKILSKGLFLLIGIISIASCASGTAFEKFKATIPPLNPDSGRIYIYRVENSAYFFRPDVLLNGKKIGETVAGGFFYVDKPAGNYNLMLSDEAEGKISFTLENKQTRYVSIRLVRGLMKGNFFPELVDEQDGLESLKYCRYTQSD